MNIFKRLWFGLKMFPTKNPHSQAQQSNPKIQSTAFSDGTRVDYVNPPAPTSKE